MCRRRRVCLRQQTTATRWRRQLSADCFGRVHIHLGRDTGALDQLGQMTADLAARFSARSARKSILEQSENYTVSPSAAN